MRKLFHCTIICLFAIYAHSQEVQWAYSLLEVSSQKTPNEYAGFQILGKPDVPHGAGEHPHAWMPSKSNNYQNIKVGFRKPMRIQQIAIEESFNPGAIHQVYVYYNDGEEHLIHTFDPSPVTTLESRMLNIFFSLTTKEVAAVRITLDGGAVPGFNAIDAIAISSLKKPVIVEVDVPDDLHADINVERLDENVNSKFKELKPLLSPDGKTLFFGRQNHPDNIGGHHDEDIWYSELNEETGVWSEAKNLGDVLNNEFPNWISAIVPDGNVDIFLLGNSYIKNSKKMKAGATVITLDGDTWGTPELLEIENDYNTSNKVNYSLSYDGNILLFSKERDDSFGDRDIYVSFKKPDNTWTEPLNVGSKVNTTGEESGPYLTADNKTLYFSSNGFKGYGGIDLYVARRLDETWTNWSTPRNLGPGINSKKDDLFLDIPVEGSYAYYTQTVSKHNTDIYRFEKKFLQEAQLHDHYIKGIISDAETNKPIEATIVFHGHHGGEVKAVSHEDGKYELVLHTEDVYDIDITAEGYISHVDTLETVEDENKTIILNYNLPHLEVGVTVTLSNVLFNQGTATILDNSLPNIEDVYRLLTENPELVIELGGHTDNRGTPEKNLDLSQKRADAVKSYLVSRGIKPKRILSKGYGGTKPIASNSSDEGRSLNRRVDFTIISK